jgi:single-strand DNA-binding protein
LLECLPLKAGEEAGHSSPQRKELIHMTNAQAIQQHPIATFTGAAASSSFGRAQHRAGEPSPLTSKRSNPMRSKNLYTAIGHLGKKPELKQTQNGTPFTRFNVACNFSYTKDDRRIDGVDWIPFIAYGKLAEIAATYLDKGSHVSVDGRLKPWKSTTSDTTRYGMDVVATDILFLDPKDQAATPEEVLEAQAHAVEAEDIPF